MWVRAYYVRAGQKYNTSIYKHEVLSIRLQI